MTPEVWCRISLYHLWVLVLNILRRVAALEQSIVLLIVIHVCAERNTKPCIVFESVHTGLGRPPRCTISNISSPPPLCTMTAVCDDHPLVKRRPLQMLSDDTLCETLLFVVQGNGGTNGCTKHWIYGHVHRSVRTLWNS